MIPDRRTRRLRLGFHPDGWDPANNLRGLDTLYGRAKSEPYSYDVVAGIIGHLERLTTGYYLDDNISESLKWAKVLLERADTYFFGEWRDGDKPNRGSNRPGHDRDHWNQFARWDDQIEPAMMVASALCRWEFFDKLAGYLRDDVKLNVDQSKEHRAFWLYFCGRHRQRPLAELDEFREIVVSGRSKREKLLLGWVEALYGGTDMELDDAVARFFKHHVTVEAKRPRNYRNIICVRCSMLLHLGLRLKRPSVVPQEMSDFLFEFPGGGTIGAGVNTGMIKEKVGTSTRSNTKVKAD